MAELLKTNGLESQIWKTLLPLRLWEILLRGRRGFIFAELDQSIHISIPKIISKVVAVHFAPKQPPKPSQGEENMDEVILKAVG